MIIHAYDEGVEDEMVIAVIEQSMHQDGRNSVPEITEIK